jgi:hypothetical protein
VKPVSWLLCALLPCCATLASEAGDTDAVRPSAGAGPFRLVTDAEVLLEAPYLLRQKTAAYREPSALALDDHAPGETALYAVAEVGGVHGIYRFVASDGRSFDDEPDPPSAVLLPSEAWEGTALAAPELSRVGSEIWLFYGADGGIGLARSSDGVSFEKLGAPVLGAATAGWDLAVIPRSPGYVELEPGDHRLFYEADGGLGEARSVDGTTWQRESAAVLEPALPSPNDPPFDAVSVGAPEPVVAQSSEGRRITRVYYVGVGGDGESAIGLAARFGASGPLVRAVAPALSTSRRPRDPAVLSYGDVSLLYFTRQAGTSTAQDYPALALAVAPATLVLPPPVSPNP